MDEYTKTLIRAAIAKADERWAAHRADERWAAHRADEPNCGGSPSLTDFIDLNDL